MTAPNLTAFPLCWPAGHPRARSRQRSKFDTTFGRARDGLFRELKLLGVTGIVFSTNLALRRDGIPLANQSNPADPGVAVYFRWKGKDRVFACDKWDRVEDNTLAVAKTIDALRGIARWGTGEMVEAAFSGFAALPPGPVAPPPPTPWQERFREVFGLFPATTDQGEVQHRYRQLAMQHHPDRGGSQDAMSEVNRLYAEWMKSRGL